MLSSESFYPKLGPHDVTAVLRSCRHRWSAMCSAPRAASSGSLTSQPLAAEDVGAPERRGQNASAMTWRTYTCLRWTRKTGLHGEVLLAAASCSLLRSDESWRNLAESTLIKIWRWWWRWWCWCWWWWWWRWCWWWWWWWWMMMTNDKGDDDDEWWSWSWWWWIMMVLMVMMNDDDDEWWWLIMMMMIKIKNIKKILWKDG